MEKQKNGRIIIRLINDERRGRRLLSARACTTSYDYCPGTYSDLAMCPSYSVDRCFAYDSDNCLANATDICKYDYAGCGEYMTDLCETDYYSGCDNGDKCTVDYD